MQAKAPFTSRVHVGLESTDIEASVDFYRRLFGVEPTKRRDDYARFEVAEPALNLSLNLVSEARRPKSLASHFGVQFSDAEGLERARAALEAAGLHYEAEESVTCCYAVQDKLWVRDPDGVPWECYRVTADGAQERKAEGTACCEPSASCC